MRIDNTSTMIVNNSLASLFLEKLKVFSFQVALVTEYIGLNVEDVIVDVFYWFDKSTNRKGKLK